MNWDNKSTSDIQSEIKKIEVDHEAIKQKMLRDYDAMIAMEKKYNEAKVELNKRNNV